MRQIVLDTETTGLSFAEGDRIIEVGIVELVDRRFTERVFHKYINPQRKVSAGAISVHGINDKFLADKPLFHEISNELIEFIDGAEIIIHNAPFDVGFLNYEFKMAKIETSMESLGIIFDTLALARKKHPGKKNNLDALCKRYNIDNSKRELHGALLDAQLLAEIYLLMTSGQRTLFTDNSVDSPKAKMDSQNLKGKKLKVISANEDEIRAHEKLLRNIKKNTEKY